MNESNSIEKTGFITPKGCYKFMAVPFNLHNGPALGDLAHSYAIVYMVVLIIPANRIDQGLERLNTLVQVGVNSKN